MRRSEKGNSKKYKILVIIALILALVVEFILVKSNTFSQFAIGNVIALFGVFAFIGMHFVVGFKKLYDYIIDNRYKLSIVLIIASTIVGFLQNSIGIKEWILATNIPLCLWWNIKFCAIILASYEFMQVITNNRNISMIGSIVISCSGAIQWNFEYINSIIIGEIIIVLLNKIITSESSNNSLLSCITILLSFIYMQTTNSFAISFVYIWIALAVWILIKNREESNYILTLGIAIASAISMFVSFKFVDFEGKFDPIENDKSASYLFTYIYNVLLPFADMEKKYLLGSFISLFPIPMLVSLYYLYKHDDHTEFLLPVTLVTVLETIFCISGFPKAISQIVGFNNISVVRCAVAVSYANLLLIFYIISNIEEIFKLKRAMQLTIISVCILPFIHYPIEFTALKYIYLFSGELCTLFILFFNYSNKKYTKVLLFTMVVFTLISGIFVNPIIKDKNQMITAPEIIVYEN